MPRAPLAALAAFGGFEIATLVGAVLQAAHERRVIVVDGFIASAAVLVAQALRPHVVQRCVAAHESAEPGHRAAAGARWASSRCCAWTCASAKAPAPRWPGRCSNRPARILREMASFESAGVSQRDASA